MIDQTHSDRQEEGDGRKKRKSEAEIERKDKKRGRKCKTGEEKVGRATISQ